MKSNENSNGHYGCKQKRRSGKEEAEKVQKLLTGWGCLIKMRVGLHDQVLDNCSDKEKHEEPMRKLNVLKGVQAKMMTLSLDE